MANCLPCRRECPDGYPARIPTPDECRAMRVNSNALASTRIPTELHANFLRRRWLCVLQGDCRALTNLIPVRVLGCESTVQNADDRAQRCDRLPNFGEPCVRSCHAIQVQVQRAAITS